MGVAQAQSLAIDETVALPGTTDHIVTVRFESQGVDLSSFEFRIPGDSRITVGSGAFSYFGEADGDCSLEASGSIFCDVRRGVRASLPPVFRIKFKVNVRSDAPLGDIPLLLQDDQFFERAGFPYLVGVAISNGKITISNTLPPPRDASGFLNPVSGTLIENNGYGWLGNDVLFKVTLSAEDGPATATARLEGCQISGANAAGFRLDTAMPLVVLSEKSGDILVRGRVESTEQNATLDCQLFDYGNPGGTPVSWPLKIAAATNAGATVPALKVDETTAEIGAVDHEVTIRFQNSTPATVGAAEFAIIYDKSRMTVTSLTPSAGAATSCTIESGAGRFKCDIARVPPALYVPQNYEIKAKVTVDANAPLGDMLLTVESYLFRERPGGDVYLTGLVSSGKIVVRAATPTPVPIYSSNPAVGTSIATSGNPGDLVTRNIAITNIGGNGLNFSCAISGPGASAFQITGGANGTALAAHATQNVSFQITVPAAGTTAHATMSCTHNGTGAANPATYALSATGQTVPVTPPVTPPGASPATPTAVPASSWWSQIAMFGLLGMLGMLAMGWRRTR